MARILLIVSLALSACGTVEGMGQDISSGARAVRNAF
ncbi:entericidin, EcnA/B family [Maritimibacter sp. 55A14]|nr:entericidin A/B family lipoprotein [Maritimibacter sp. 55A14]PWE33169.1 entericidin, EcnA/B family [Maritimibacter sp. 55A14]